MGERCCLTTDEVREAFHEEVATLGGKVTECIDDGSLLFGRSVLARKREVARKDVVQAGVGIRVNVDRCIIVQPYIFRLVCRNGATFAHAFEATSIEASGYADPERVLRDIRGAIRACGSVEAFTEAFSAMKSARNAHIEPAVWLMMLERSGRLPRAYATEVLSRFAGDRDRSRFGLMNAVTSLARDTQDPQRKADLEELGGSLTLVPDRDSPLPPRSAGRTRLSAGVR